MEDGEPVLSLPDNRSRDWRHGTVALTGDPYWRDYEFGFEMQVLLPPEPSAGAWPGIVFRAQDTENYELVWLMPRPVATGDSPWREPAEGPGPEAGDNVVYLSVAHGLVPWWADAYANNPRGSVAYSRGEWLAVSVRVQGIDASVYAGGRQEPVLTVRLTYYLEGVRVGVYCGTGTSAKFRRFRIAHLEPTSIPDPPENPRPRQGA